MLIHNLVNIIKLVIKGTEYMTPCGKYIVES